MPSSCSTKSASWAPCIAELRVVKAEAEPTRAASMHARAIAPARPDERSRARAVSALPRVCGAQERLRFAAQHGTIAHSARARKIKLAQGRKERADSFFASTHIKTRRLHKKQPQLFDFLTFFTQIPPGVHFCWALFLCITKSRLVPLCSPCDSPLYFPKGRAESAAAVVALARRAGAEGFAMGRRCCFLLAALAPAVQGFTTIQQTAYGAIP